MWPRRRRQPLNLRRTNANGTSKNTKKSIQRSMARVFVLWVTSLLLKPTFRYAQIGWCQTQFKSWHVLLPTNAHDKVSLSKNRCRVPKRILTFTAALLYTLHRMMGKSRPLFASVFPRQDFFVHGSFFRQKSVLQCFESSAEINIAVLSLLCRTYVVCCHFAQNKLRDK